jgi:Uma2 family endonuclease
MSTQTSLLTVDQFLQLAPPKEGHYELHHGEVVLMPPPKLGHQRIQKRVLHLLEAAAGERMWVTLEMAFRPTPEYEVWQADVGCVAIERYQQTSDHEYIWGAPDLIVEVLSPGNTVDEMNDRQEIALQNGCRSFWLVDPKRRRVSITEGSLTRHYGLSDVIESALLGAPIAVQDIFGNPDR